MNQPPVIHISTKHDGSMLLRSDPHNASITANRTNFLTKHGIDPSKTTRLSIIYEGDDYCRYRISSTDDGAKGITDEAMPACDALVTTTPGHALFLPIADCIGAVLIDTRQNILMVSHLGRHSLEQHGATRSIAYLAEQFGSLPEDIMITLSPSAGNGNYPLFAFNNRSMQDVALEQFQAGGVPLNNIAPSTIDTTMSEEYFSHSEYLKQNREDDGRFAVVAYLP